MKGVELLIDRIVKNELHEYSATGSYVYVAEYEDGELLIVYNSLSAKEARSDMEFEIVASAKWSDNRGYPGWIIRNDDDIEVAIINTDQNGIVESEDDVFTIN